MRIQHNNYGCQKQMEKTAEAHTMAREVRQLKRSLSSQESELHALHAAVAAHEEVTAGLKVSQNACPKTPKTSHC